MLIADAQREVRSTYLGGFAGQCVSGVLWLTSAALTTSVSPRMGFWTLALAGTMIYPLTQLMLRAMGRPASLSPGNPMRWLAMQVAFTVPFTLPLAGAATLHRLDWFYPACMLIVGAHYMPFMFLYGMWQFGILAAVLMGAGVWLGMTDAAPVAAGGWLTGAALLAFAFVGRRVVMLESSKS